MKKFLYISALLISSSMFAMQQTNNKKPLFTKQQIAGAALIAGPVIYTGLTPLCVVAPPLTAGMLLLGAVKMGSTIVGTSMLVDAHNQRQNNKDK